MLSFTLFTRLLARLCFSNMTVGDGQISKETPDWIGLGLDGLKQSEVPTAEKLTLTVTDRELNAGY